MAHGFQLEHITLYDYRCIIMTRFHLSLKRIFPLTCVKMIFLHRTVFQRDFDFTENEK